MECVWVSVAIQHVFVVHVKLELHSKLGLVDEDEFGDCSHIDTSAIATECSSLNTSGWEHSSSQSGSFDAKDSGVKDSDAKDSGAKEHLMGQESTIAGGPAAPFEYDFLMVHWGALALSGGDMVGFTSHWLPARVLSVTYVWFGTLPTQPPRQRDYGENEERHNGVPGRPPLRIPFFPAEGIRILPLSWMLASARALTMTTPYKWSKRAEEADRLRLYGAGQMSAPEGDAVRRHFRLVLGATAAGRRFGTSSSVKYLSSGCEALRRHPNVLGQISARVLEMCPDTGTRRQFELEWGDKDRLDFVRFMALAWACGLRQHDSVQNRNIPYASRNALVTLQMAYSHGLANLCVHVAPRWLQRFILHHHGELKWCPSGFYELPCCVAKPEALPCSHIHRFIHPGDTGLLAENVVLDAEVFMGTRLCLLFTTWHYLSAALRSSGLLEDLIAIVSGYDGESALVLAETERAAIEREKRRVSSCLRLWS